MLRLQHVIVASLMLGGVALGQGATTPIDQPARGEDDTRWILHAPEARAPAEGFGVVVVFPGGNGSADFAPFVGGRLADEIGEGFLLVQMIAPPIDEGDRNAIVWPTRGLPDDRVEYTMESVVDEMLASIREVHTIDDNRIYALGWSSGGPPSYAMTLVEDSAFDGAFVAMSVFKPETLPPLENAEGKSYYILHSPGDFIHMRFPERAERELRQAGARTTLQTYEGRHGWTGDSISRIGNGMRWLDAE